MTQLLKRKGSILVMAAVVLTAMMGVGALAIDAAYLMHTKAELQSVSDAAALAAASGLSSGPAEARRRAIDYANANPVLGEGFQLTNDNIEIGLWNEAAGTFTPTAGAPNSVRITASLQGANAPELFFGKIFGLDRSPVVSVATSTLGSRNIVLAFDRSDSMAYDGSDPPQPLTDTKAAARAFMDFVDSYPVVGDSAGLVMYNEEAVRVRFSNGDRLTGQFDEVKSAIDLIEIDPDAFGQTNIAQAVYRSRQILNGEGDDRSLKVVVLLSDGKTTTSLWGRPGDAWKQDAEGNWYLPNNNRAERHAYREADRCRNDGIILYTISLGDDTNQELMEDMADLTGGKHFYAPTPAELDDVFIEISERIPVILVE